jgi:hypothetical protein
MHFFFIDHPHDEASVLPPPLAEASYDAWAKVHYGLMGHLSMQFPQLRVSGSADEFTDLYYGDDWFETRQTAVVARNWSAFCLPVAEAIQAYLQRAAADWLVTFAVEAVRELEVGGPMVVVVPARGGAWVHSFERSASETRRVCQERDVFAWLFEASVGDR